MRIKYINNTFFCLSLLVGSVGQAAQADTGDDSIQLKINLEDFLKRVRKMFEEVVQENIAQLDKSPEAPQAQPNPAIVAVAKPVAEPKVSAIPAPTSVDIARARFGRVDMLQKEISHGNGLSLEQLGFCSEFSLKKNWFLSIAGLIATPVRYAAQEGEVQNLKDLRKNILEGNITATNDQLKAVCLPSNFYQNEEYYKRLLQEDNKLKLAPIKSFNHISREETILP